MKDTPNIDISLSLSDDFRLFCGDLGNEVTDEYLYRAFAKYPSILKAKVVRDKRTKKTKGFGFVSFKEPQDYLKAMREMNGKFCFICIAIPSNKILSTMLYPFLVHPCSKIEMKCFSRILFVIQGGKFSKPHFHGPFRRRISDEDKRNL